jgi:flagellar hook assembly protein FlgD
VKNFELLDAYPNPFNMNTVIPFKLAQSANVNLSIYNTRGQWINTIASGFYNEGNHQVTWSGLNDEQQVVPSGVYFYRLTTAATTEHPVDLSRKIVLVK